MREGHSRSNRHSSFAENLRTEMIDVKRLSPNERVLLRASARVALKHEVITEDKYQELIARLAEADKDTCSDGAEKVRRVKELLLRPVRDDGN